MEGRIGQIRYIYSSSFDCEANSGEGDEDGGDNTRWKLTKPITRIIQVIRRDDKACLKVLADLTLVDVWWI